MKCLSLVSGRWFERLPCKFSDQEKEILQDFSESNDQARKDISLDIQKRSFKEADISDAALAQSIYDSKKIDEAILIMANIMIPSLHGTINYKIENEYRSIKF